MSFGVGISSGPEATVTLANTLIKLSPDDICAPLDLKNAFGEISRTKVLNAEALMKHLPK